MLVILVHSGLQGQERESACLEENDPHLRVHLPPLCPVFQHWPLLLPPLQRLLSLHQ